MFLVTTPGSEDTAVNNNNNNKNPNPSSQVEYILKGDLENKQMINM